jgi:hypothetical protein
MNRRDALGRVAILLGGSVVGANAFLTGCRQTEQKAAAGLPFSADRMAFLDEVAETIIPTTDTPGAKAAKVGAFMNTMVSDCYEERDQKTFLAGMDAIDAACQKAHGHGFMKATAEQRNTLLSVIDKEASEYAKKKKPEEPAHYFTLMKQLTLLGYFTSEVGATQALRYVAIPGKYEGCIPYKKGDKAWAT